MVGNREEYWVPEDYEGMSAGRYLATRVSSLKPPMLNVPNPWKLLRMLNRQQWSFFALAFWAWTWDAFDFFTVSLTVSDLAKQFGKANIDITWGITLVLMFRSVGSIAFGMAADRYGRKWPFIVNNILFIALELVSDFPIRSYFMHWRWAVLALGSWPLAEMQPRFAESHGGATRLGQTLPENPPAKWPSSAIIPAPEPRIATAGAIELQKLQTRRIKKKKKN